MEERAVGSSVAHEHGVARRAVALGFGLHVLDGGSGREDPQRVAGGRGVGGQRPEGTHVVDHVGCAAVGRHHQVVVPGVNHQPSDRRRGKSVSPLHPRRAPVQARVQAELGAEEEQVGLHRVLLDHVDEAPHAAAGFFANADAAVPAHAAVSHAQRLPALPVVLRAVGVGRPVAASMVVVDHVGGGRVVLGRLHVGRPGRRGHAGNPIAHAGPVGTVVASELHGAVVGGDPDQTPLHGTGGDAQDRRVGFRAGGVDGEAAALGVALLLGVVGGQVRRDDLPRGALVPRAVHELGAQVDRGGVEGIDGERRVPAEAQGLAVRVHGGDVASVARRLVEAHQAAALGKGIAEAAVAEVGHGGEAVAAADPGPVQVHDPPLGPHRHGTEPGAVVLQAAVDVEGRVHVHGDVVELGQRQVLDEAPVVASVVGEGDPAVLAQDHEAAVVGVYPELVHVPVDRLAGHHRAERAPRVLAHLNRAVKAVEPVLVGRVDPQVGVVEGPGRDAPSVADRAPAGAPVVGAQELAPLRFHQRVGHVRVRARDRDADPPQLARRQAVLRPQALPACAPVVGDEESAPRSARTEEPRPAPKRPHRRKELVGVRRVHHQVPDPRALVHVQHALPALAAVGGLVDAALLPVAPRRPHGADVHRARVVGVHDDAVDALRPFQPHVPPGVAPVEAPVDAVADARRVARVPFPGSRPHHVRVRGRDRHCADPQHRLLVEHRAPGEPSVAGPPHAAGGRAHVDRRRVLEVDGHVRDAPAHARRPDAPGRHGGEVGGGGLGRGLGEKWEWQERSRCQKPGRKEAGVVVSHRFSVVGAGCWSARILTRRLRTLPAQWRFAFQADRRRSPRPCTDAPSAAATVAAGAPPAVPLGLVLVPVPVCVPNRPIPRRQAARSSCPPA